MTSAANRVSLSKLSQAGLIGFLVLLGLAVGVSAQDSEAGLQKDLSSDRPSWLSTSGSRRSDASDSITVELGQEVLVDRLNDEPAAARRSAPPSRVILMERSSGQQFILNPGQDIALILPLDKVRGGLYQGLLYPLPYIAPVSSGYGIRVHPITGLESFHQGIDLAAPAGTPVLAAYSGQVIAAGPAGNLGNAVVLAHDNSRRTRYGHMSSIVAQPNTWVEQGQLIGYVGSTGRSTGPHLHFEFWTRASGQWLAIDISEQLRLAVAAVRSPAETSLGNINAIGGN
ncbi:M23 family metallopeptidase [Synechococcus sp. PCC 7336]|uniref:M23 family metallopeptidase n=1 Tax=Synechococcus sp. PCC 7336 TaxID=195250 RepID=UPI00034A0179|nr:M23 family metallopeptidase [Synechococcus sp. PCC 7336]